MDDPTTKVELDYAPRAPVFRRRRVRLALILLALAIAIGIAWWKSRPFISRLRCVYADRQFMKFTVPPDQVAYEEDPARAAALATRADYLRMSSQLPGVMRPTAQAATQPGLLPVGFLPPGSTWRYASTAVTTAYAGGLTSPDGQEWIVIVRLAEDGIPVDRDRGLYFMPRAYTRYPLVGPLPRTAYFPAMGKDTDFWLARFYRLRLYFGQRDPQHPDRFTMRYVLNEVPGVIEGRIDNEGKIKFTVPEGGLGNRLH